MKKTNSRAGNTVKLTEESSTSIPSQTQELISKTEPPPPAQSKAPIHVPPILLEGDDSPQIPEARQTHKYTIGPAPVPERFEPESRELPESYGTGKLLLTPRDPYWLYAHWDLSPDQQRAYNQRSAHGHMVVRIHAQEHGAPHEVHLHPESRHWFVEVGHADLSYVAELGFYQAGAQWFSISTSSPARTPPDRLSEDKTIQFATPAGMVVGGEQLLLANAAPAANQEPRGPGVNPPRVEWLPALDPQVQGRIMVIPQGSGPTPSREFIKSFGDARSAGASAPMSEAALGDLATMQSFRPASISSFEITESIRREIEREIASAQFGAQSPLEANFASSPMGEASPQVKAFWFNVNAELIIYGATRPDAAVTIGGQPIHLRPDGTFSCRLALPDGEFELEVAAASLDNDSRRAQLKFARRSRYDETMTNPR